MRSLILSAFAAVLMAVVSCQKPIDQEQVPGPFGSKLSNARLACTYTTLSGVISTNTTLSASTKYLLSGIVQVASGVTLTIPAGTIITGEKATRAALVIERGAALIANGTSTNPIVFTSDQLPGSRAAGDWRGIILLGRADNNVSGKVFTVQKGGVSFSAGLASPINTDNSGSLTYVRIEYAGHEGVGDTSPSGLLMAAVGSGTTVNHVMVNNSIKDGFAYLGGKVNTKYLASFESYRNDFSYDIGHQANHQFGLAMRRNTTKFDATESNGIVVQNDGTPSVVNTPKTSPVISNYNIIGPIYCAGSALPDFDYGIKFTNDAEGYVANTLVSGFTTGVFYQGAETVANANSNGTLKWMYNTFIGYSTAAGRFGFNNGASWNTASGACTTTQTLFMTNPSSLTCASFGYQSLTTGYGFSSTLCGEYCSTAPNFTLGSSSILNSTFPVGSPVDVAFFDKGTKPRGAFGTSDTAWASEAWLNWCAESTDYCI